MSRFVNGERFSVDKSLPKRKNRPLTPHLRNHAAERHFNDNGQKRRPHPENVNDVNGDVNGEKRLSVDIKPTQNQRLIYIVNDVNDKNYNINR